MMMNLWRTTYGSVQRASYCSARSVFDGIILISYIEESEILISYIEESVYSIDEC